MTQTLDELVEVLGVIEEMANQGRQAFDADRRQRWSVEWLWIFAGNLAERHCRVLGIDEGADPWSELIATRNVYSHYTPSAISYDRVWAVTSLTRHGCSAPSLPSSAGNSPCQDPRDNNLGAPCLPLCRTRRSVAGTVRCARATV